MRVPAGGLFTGDGAVRAIPVKQHPQAAEASGLVDSPWGRLGPFRHDPTLRSFYLKSNLIFKAPQAGRRG